MNSPERVSRTWRMVVAYHGAQFQGWQKQATGRTVQETLEDALGKLAGERVIVRGAGRTDAGVHARGQLVSTTFASRVPEGKMLLAANSQLPPDLSVMSVDEVDAGFDAKRDSIAKRYVYRVHNHLVFDPFVGSTRWQFRGRLDVDKMRRAAADLVGELDYQSFRAVSCDAKHARRYLWCVEVRHEHPLIEIEVRGNAFCKNMVRIIAGTLVDVGRGKIGADAIPAILAARDRTAAGITAPAEGLMMEEVYLPEHAERAGIPEGASFPGWPPHLWPAYGPRPAHLIARETGSSDGAADNSAGDDDAADNDE